MQGRKLILVGWSCGSLVHVALDMGQENLKGGVINGNYPSDARELGYLEKSTMMMDAKFMDILR